jgi:hypothetical protein
MGYYKSQDSAGAREEVIRAAGFIPRELSADAGSEVLRRAGFPGMGFMSPANLRSGVRARKLLPTRREALSWCVGGGVAAMLAATLPAVAEAAPLVQQEFKPADEYPFFGAATRWP